MRLLRRSVLIAVVCLVPLAAAAHPLGNFTTNQYLGVHVEAGGLTLDYVLDLAEIPASQQRRAIDSDGDDEITGSEEEAFVASECALVGEEIEVMVGGAPLAIAAAGEGALAFPPGEAGLPTLRLECRFAGPLVLTTETALRVDNANFADRIGWREMTLTGVDVAVDTMLPATSATSRLSDYPADVLSSPVDIRSGVATVRPAVGTNLGEPPPPLGARAARSTPVDALAALVDPAAGTPALPIAMAVALGLGVVHALAPGHGKTVMAAYLVGSGGRVRQAVGLGVSVAVSHTLGVLVLGLVTLVGSAAFAPDSVFPILSVVSGVIVVGIGAWMMIGWFRRRGGDHHHHDDDHDHPHSHSHGGVSHTHPHSGPLGEKSGWKVLASMGLAGGLVPSTSAVVLLLAAVNLGRIPLGILLIVLFGVGMAATLVGVGLGLVTATRLGMTRLGNGGWLDRVQRVMTPAAAVVVMAVGAFLSISAL